MTQNSLYWWSCSQWLCYQEPSYLALSQVIISKSCKHKNCQLKVLVFPASYKAWPFICTTVYFCFNIFIHLIFNSDNCSSWWKLFIATQGQERSAVINNNILTCCHFFTYPVTLHEKVFLPRVFLTLRFQVEKFSDSGNSRRFDYQDSGPVSAEFMTSTPQTKSQAVFSPPKSYQVSQITCYWAFDD